MTLKALIQEYRSSTNKLYCKGCNVECTDLLLIKNKYGFLIFYPICTRKGHCSNQTKDITMCIGHPKRY